MKKSTKILIWIIAIAAFLGSIYFSYASGVNVGSELMLNAIVDESHGTGVIQLTKYNGESVILIEMNKSLDYCMEAQMSVEEKYSDFFN